MISYAPFWNTLKEKGISTYVLIKDKHIASSTLQRMRRNESVSMQTIDDLCNALKCNVSDIVEILIDDNSSQKI